MSWKFDIDHVRKQFPGLNQKQVYFDNAGGSQTLGTVIDSVHEYLSNNNVQLGATYPVGVTSNTRFKEGNEAAAALINAHPDEVVLGSASTQLLANLSSAFDFPAGSEIVISNVDHETDVAPWVRLAERLRLTLKWWTFEDPNTSDPRGPMLTTETLGKLLTDKTVFVSCTHASNILGTIHDIKSFNTFIKKTCPNAVFMVDGVAFAPHRKVDVKDLGVDFYALSLYKVYGAHISCLYGKKEAHERYVKSIAHFFNNTTPQPHLHVKLTLAGANYELTASITRILEYLSTPSLDEFWSQSAAHEEELSAPLLKYLTAPERKGKVRIYGSKVPDAKVRIPVISFKVQGWGSRELVETVDKAEGKDGRKFGIRWGHFYSRRLMDVFKLENPDEGIVRVSMVHYNTVDEIEDFVNVLDTILKTKA